MLLSLLLLVVVVVLPLVLLGGPPATDPSLLPGGSPLVPPFPLGLQRTGHFGPTLFGPTFIPDRRNRAAAAAGGAQRGRGGPGGFGSRQKPPAGRRPAPFSARDMRRTLREQPKRGCPPALPQTTEREGKGLWGRRVGDSNKNQGVDPSAATRETGSTPPQRALPPLGRRGVVAVRVRRPQRGKGRATCSQRRRRRRRPAAASEQLGAPPGVRAGQRGEEEQQQQAPWRGKGRPRARRRRRRCRSRRRQRTGCR